MILVMLIIFGVSGISSVTAGCATLYDHNSYGGSSLEIQPEQTMDYPELNSIGWNDRVSSVIVTRGCILTASEHHGGYGYNVEFQGNNPSIHNTNDLSSFTCSCSARRNPMCSGEPLQGVCCLVAGLIKWTYNPISKQCERFQWSECCNAGRKNSFYDEKTCKDVCTSDILKRRCSSGWSLHEYKCYKVFTSPKSWPQAQDMCRSLGGDLASIRDEGVGRFIYLFMLEFLTPPRKYFVGGRIDSSYFNNRTWTWAEYTPPMGYNFGEYNLLNAENERVLRILNDKDNDCLLLEERTWGTANCETAMPYVCSKPA